MLVFGWFGAHRKQLLKVQNMYKEIGFNPTIIPADIYINQYCLNTGINGNQMVH